jgi:hypothetical protein
MSIPNKWQPPENADPRRGTQILGYWVPRVDRSKLPPSEILQINGTAVRTINFPSEFNGYANDVIIDNFAAGNLTVRINGAIDTKRIVGGGAFSASDQHIVQIEMVAGATDWEITFALIKLI